MYSVVGKVGLVTGGSQGIGAAIAEELLEAGLRGVSILARSEGNGLRIMEKLNNKFGKGKAIYIKCDVSDKKQFEDAFKKTVEVFKNIDIVVNNAIASGRESRNWENSIAVNLNGTITGTLLAYEEYLPKYSSDKGGVVINISSTVGMYGFPSTPVYAASKSGIILFSLSLGCDYHYSRTNIKVIVVCPGPTYTSALNSTEDDFLGPSYFEHFKLEMATLSHPQSASFVGKETVEIVKKGSNGSVWIVEDDKPGYEVKLSVEKVDN